MPEVLSELAAWRRDEATSRGVQSVAGTWPGHLNQLDPLEAPWTTELFVEHGARWTCYLNNDLNGGDPFPVVGHLSMVMETHAVIAIHQPKIPVGHASTQFQLVGPEGEPPLMYVRTVAAHAEDGRWSWHEGGEPQEYEQTDRYRARLKRNRLDRPLLLEYLSALGIDVDNDEAYGSAVVVRQRANWPTRKLTLKEARHWWGLE